MTIIKKERVQLTQSSSMPSSPEGSKPEAGPKEVQLIKHGDSVHAIEFCCSCGETSVLELDYAADKTAQGQAA